MINVSKREPIHPRIDGTTGDLEANTSSNDRSCLDVEKELTIEAAGALIPAEVEGFKVFHVAFL